MVVVKSVSTSHAQVDTRVVKYIENKQTEKIKWLKSIEVDVENRMGTRIYATLRSIQHKPIRIRVYKFVIVHMGFSFSGVTFSCCHRFIENDDTVFSALNIHAFEYRLSRFRNVYEAFMASSFSGLSCIRDWISLIANTVCHRVEWRSSTNALDCIGTPFICFYFTYFGEPLKSDKTLIVDQTGRD